MLRVLIVLKASEFDLRKIDGGYAERGRMAAKKKDGTNGQAVRAGRPVTQTTSGPEDGYDHLHNRNKYTIAYLRKNASTKIRIYFGRIFRPSF
jgi:hypothetical protein